MCHCWSIWNTCYHVPVYLLKQERDPLEKRILEQYLSSLLNGVFTYLQFCFFLLLLIIKNAFAILAGATWNVIAHYLQIIILGSEQDMNFLGITVKHCPSIYVLFILFYCRKVWLEQLCPVLVSKGTLAATLCASAELRGVFEFGMT